jgi:flagellar protein FliT
MAASETLRCYESIKQLSGEMRLAAQRGDWDELLRQEASCVSLVTQLRAQLEKQPLAVHEKGQKIQLIRQILADDAEIRNLLHPWLARMGTLLQGKHVAQRVEQAYRPSEG